MSRSFDLSTYLPARDGQTDDTAPLQQCFAAVAAAGGGTVLIPPGDYYLSGAAPIPLASGTTVTAYGARFHLPHTLGDRARLVLFAGENVSDFAWFGGAFRGHCFDPRRTDNTWAPNANTRVLALRTTAGGRTHNLRFRDLDGQGIAGAVVNVEGVKRPGSEREVDSFADHVLVQDCALVDCGKFMWDYGLLWQILVWPEDYSAAEQAMAWRYFRQDLVRRPVRLADGDDRVWFDPPADPLPVARTGRGEEAVCFFGDPLPGNLARGRQYFVVEATREYVRVADAPGGKPLRFAGQGGANVGLIHNLAQAFYHLFAPIGAGPGKGGVDLVACRHTTLSGNRMSALGDTMHLQCCHHNVFTGNSITGSRMGAFFIAEFCRDSVVTGNLVDGTNGSRVMSVEKSSEDVTIVGNTFRNGGRGSWINQPRRLILQGNVFINNTTKCERDPRRGRRTFATGDYERYAEIYFTLHEPDGEYGPVIVRDNVFETGPECRDALHFATRGHDLVVAGNVFGGAVRTVRVDPGCARVHLGDNPGMVVAG